MSDKDLATAWAARRHTGNRPAQTATSRAPMLEDQTRPDSLADAILAKRRAAKEPSDLEIVNSIPDATEEETDISVSPEPLPFPTNRAEAIRMKLKALRAD